MNKQEIESAINGLEQLKPILQLKLLKINHEGLGKEDSEELGEHFDTALYALAQQLNNGWIPTSERLPDGSGKALIYCENNEVYDSAITVSRYSMPDNKWRAPNAHSYFENVIAWQPLPEPYKENTNE